MRKYILMATGEDGTEFRATDAEYDSTESASNDLDEARENWPCANFRIEPLHDKEWFMQQHQYRHDEGTEDLY